MMRRAYPTDLSDVEWACLEPLELYYDGPREQWTDEEGKPLFDKELFKKLDPKDLLEELGPT